MDLINTIQTLKGQGWSKRRIAPRDPCEKMDAICRGLRDLMMENRQGVLAQVIRSGRIKIGDSIRLAQAVFAD